MRLREIYLMLSVGFFFRVCVAIWNGFWGPSIGATHDAESFHAAGTNLSLLPGSISDLSRLATKYHYFFLNNPDYSKGYHLLDHIYAQWLAIIYSVTTDSLFVGSLVSSLVWMASGLFLIQIMHLLSTNNFNQFWAMMIYALLPSSIFLTSVTLREAYMLALVNLACYLALNSYLNKSIKHWLLLLGVIIIMKNFHSALFFFGLFILTALATLFFLRRKPMVSVKKLVIIIFLLAITAYFMQNRLGSFIFYAPYSNEMGLGNAIADFRAAGLNNVTRTRYADGVEINKLSDLLLLVPVFFLQYFFEPMPWRISVTLDWIVMLENILRFGLILKSLTGLPRMPPKKLPFVLLIFLPYLTLEIIWSFGTTNWGTAIRHHIPGIGLLIASAFACSRQEGRKRNNLLP